MQTTFNKSALYSLKPTLKQLSTNIIKTTLIFKLFFYKTTSLPSAPKETISEPTMNVCYRGIILYNRTFWDILSWRHPFIRYKRWVWLLDETYTSEQDVEMYPQWPTTFQQAADWIRTLDEIYTPEKDVEMYPQWSSTFCPEIEMKDAGHLHPPPIQSVTPRLIAPARAYTTQNATQSNVPRLIVPARSYTKQNATASNVSYFYHMQSDRRSIQHRHQGEPNHFRGAVQ